MSEIIIPTVETRLSYYTFISPEPTLEPHRGKDSSDQGHTWDMTFYHTLLKKDLTDFQPVIKFQPVNRLMRPFERLSVNRFQTWFAVVHPDEGTSKP